MEVLVKTSLCWAMFVCLLRTSQAVLIEGCNGGWLTVQEGSKQPIVCSGIVNHRAVIWSIQASNGSVIFRESCNMTTCEYTNGISISAVSANLTSLLTICEDHRKYGNLHVTCDNGTGTSYACLINIEGTRNYSDCKFYDDDSAITGHCYMEKAYTSNVTVYSCQWTAGYTADNTSAGWNIPSALVYTDYQESTQLYYKGICYFSYPRPKGNFTVKLDGSMISQELVPNGTNFPPPPYQNTFASLRVENGAVNPLLLMCSGRPEPVQSYEWSGLVCSEGNQTQNVCLASTSNLTPQQPLVTCTVTSADKNYNGSRVTARFHLQLEYANTTATNSTAAHESTTPGVQISTTQTTHTVSDQTFDQTTTASDGTSDKTTTASDDTSDKTTTASDRTSDNTTIASYRSSDKTITASDHTLDKTTTASDRTSVSVQHPSIDNDDKSDSLPWVAIGGGVGGAVIIIIIVVVVIVICRRRVVSEKPPEVTAEEEFEEHINVVYESGDQETNCTSARPQQVAINTTIPSYDENQLDDGEIEMEYTTVRLNPIAHAASGTGAGGMTHTNSAPAMRHDMTKADTELTDDIDPNYSAGDVQRPKTFPAPSGTSSHGDEYAVVDKSAKGKKGATFPLEDYAQVNKPKPNPAGDVYAEVDRSSKCRSSQVVQQNKDYIEKSPRQDSRPTMAVKPDLKPKPTLQPYSGANPGDTSAEEDEYNVLNLGTRAHNTSTDDAEQYYSHIRM